MKNQQSNPASRQSEPAAASIPAGSSTTSKKNLSSTPDSAAKLDQSNYDGTLPPETGGQKGPEPTRYGDWEKNGRCTDF